MCLLKYQNKTNVGNKWKYGFLIWLNMVKGWIWLEVFSCKNFSVMVRSIYLNMDQSIKRVQTDIIFLLTCNYVSGMFMKFSSTLAGLCREDSSHGQSWDTVESWHLYMVYRHTWAILVPKWVESWPVTTERMWLVIHQ